MAFKTRHGLLHRRSSSGPARYGIGRGRTLAVRTAPRPFWDGIARIFDFTGSLNPRKRLLPPNVADRRALRRDWEAVGDDLMTVIGRQKPKRPLDDGILTT